MLLLIHLRVTKIVVQGQGRKNHLRRRVVVVKGTQSTISIEGETHEVLVDIPVMVQKKTAEKPRERSVNTRTETFLLYDLFEMDLRSYLKLLLIEYI